MNKYLENLSRIEFVVTMACTGKCRHCSEGDHIHCTEHIDTETAVGIVRKICSRYRIASLMVFGGESLLFPETVCAIHTVAAELGIGSRQLITNGFFQKIMKKSKKLSGILLPAESMTCCCPWTHFIRKPSRWSRFYSLPAVLFSRGSRSG